MHEQNIEIAFIFWEMNNALQCLGRPWKEIRSSYEFSQSLRNLDRPIEQVAETDALLRLQGVDAALAVEIRAYIDTGTCSTLDLLEREIPPSARSLSRAGFYPPTIDALAALGIESAEALDNALATGTLRPVVDMSGQERNQVASYQIAKLLGWQMGSIELPPWLPDDGAREVNDAPPDWGDLTVTERFACADEDHVLIKQFCEAQVVEWRWFTHEVYEPTPYELLLQERKRGRRIKEPPPRNDERHGKVQYGVDPQGRYVVERHWNRYTRGYNEQFFLWQTPRRLETVYYHLESGVAAVGGWDCPPYNVKRILHDESGRVVRVEAANAKSENVLRYFYESTQLTHFVSAQHTTTLEYDDNDRVIATVRHGTRRVLKPK